MTALIIYFAVAAGLLLLLLLAVLRRTPTAEGTAEALLGARQAVRALRLNLLPQELVARFFAKEDLDYAIACAPRAVQRLLIDERRRIVLAWISQVHRQIVSLQHFHFRHSRLFGRLSLTSELALALEFAALRVRCRALYLLFYLRGPYSAPSVAGTTAAAAARFCAVSEKSLAFLNAGESQALAGGSAGGGATA